MKIRACSLASLLILAAVSAPLFVSSNAMAQGDDAMTDMARERFQEGVAFYDAKEYAKARASFLQAYAIKKHPSVLLNLAQSELRSGHEADAAQHFDQFLRENPSAAEVERQEAERGLAAALTRVHALTVTAPAGAQLFVDNEPVGTAPLESRLFLAPGSRLLEARQGGEITNATISAVAGGQGTQTLTFGGPTAPPGFVPGPTEPPPPGGGTPQVPPEDEGGFSFSTSDPREPFLDWAKRGPVSWIGGGLFGVGLIGGVVFALTSSSNYSDADSIRDQILEQKRIREAAGHRVGSPCASNGPDYAHFREACSRWDDRASTGDTHKTLSTVGFVTAGVGAAVVVGGYFLTAKRLPATDSGKQPKGPSVAAAPVVGEGFQGLSFFGQF
ncbi:MAG: tetratricopeptide repeat protein [Polyangiaceae bacterium]|nr:tetratricopeptide repeat protein [Polyangiaceae bacterium]MCW5791754.1 tetratricopeptide repeat protein [Polyangiaceae bacterium]